jgi:hypothetical protein
MHAPFAKSSRLFSHHGQSRQRPVQQNATLEKCLPFLKGIHSTQKDFNDHGVPALQRDA